MKKILILATLLAFTCNVSFASMYKMDNDAVDAIFADAVEMTSVSSATSSLLGGLGANAEFNNPNPWAAWAICWVVGPLGIHRHYLGTKGNMWAIYTFTCCGIFGIVPMVDFWVLFIAAIKDDISKYTNNDSFFMW
ncbi:MAG: TM2 domain-containing protein [Bacteroidales bacterium]|nr:TM2 domain-containing protein [Bacteroidales bacterium]